VGVQPYKAKEEDVASREEVEKFKKKARREIKRAKDKG
jgi:hypothetical protein